MPGGEISVIILNKDAEQNLELTSNFGSGNLARSPPKHCTPPHSTAAKHTSRRRPPELKGRQ